MFKDKSKTTIIKLKNLKKMKKLLCSFVFVLSVVTLFALPCLENVNNVVEESVNTTSSQSNYLPNISAEFRFPSGDIAYKFSNNGSVYQHHYRSHDRDGYRKIEGSDTYTYGTYHLEKGSHAKIVRVVIRWDNGAISNGTISYGVLAGNKARLSIKGYTYDER